MQRARLLATVLVLVVAASACGGATEATTHPSPDETTIATDAGTTETAGAFPVTLEHAHGETTIEQRPERVVTVGIRDQDAVLALGVTPVGIRDWFGDQPDAVWPWAQDELGDADPEVLPAGELDMEAIAALEPDVIIGVDADLGADEYRMLTEIAPTVAQPAEYTPHAIPWRERTLRVARALGEQEQAERIVAEVEDTLAAAAEAHPEFADATALMGLAASDGQAYTYGSDDVLSLPFLVEDLVPELERAVDGDPSTTSPYGG